MRGHVALAEQGRPTGIDPAGDQRRCHFPYSTAQLRRVLMLADGVKVGEEEETFSARLLHRILHAHPIADRAQIIAEVKVAGGLDA